VAARDLVDAGRAVAMAGVEDEPAVAVGAVHRPVDAKVEIDPGVAEGAAHPVAGHAVGVDADGLGLGPGGGCGRSGLSGHGRGLRRRERLAAARAGSRYASLPFVVNAPEPRRSS